MSLQHQPNLLARLPYLSAAAPWLASVALHAAALLAVLAVSHHVVKPPPLVLDLAVYPAPLAKPAAVAPAQAATLPAPRLAPSEPTPVIKPAPASTVLAPILTALSAPANPATTVPAAPAKITAPAALQSQAPPASMTATAPAPPTKIAARFDAAYLQNPAPPYPAQSRRLGEAGTVQLLVKVTALGTVEALSIHRSSGFARLDDAAKLAVQTWRFVPARLGDAATADEVIVPIVFKVAP